jgi:hypothetical protein
MGQRRTGYVCVNIYLCMRVYVCVCGGELSMSTTFYVHSCVCVYALHVRGYTHVRIHTLIHTHVQYSNAGAALGLGLYALSSDVLHACGIVG